VRSTRSLFVVAVVTVFSLLLSAVWSLGGVDFLTSGPFALFGFGLLVALQTLLLPVFFAALYLDAGVVRNSTDPWSPSRWLWVGGGALATLVVYATARNTTAVVVLVGLAYLGRRFHAARVSTADEVEPAPESDDAGRSVAGVSVHVLGLAAAAGAYARTSGIAVATLSFGGVAAVVFAASEHSFTRANARNALNWSLSVTVFSTVLAVPTLLYAMDGQLYGFAVAGPLLPPALDGAAKFGSLALTAVALLAVVATVPFAAFAAWKAALGDSWSYPLAASVVERLGRLTAD